MSYLLCHIKININTVRNKIRAVIPAAKPALVTFSFSSPVKQNKKH
jgi:hypothetical protein